MAESVIKKPSSKWKLMWTNSKPSSSFSAQTVAIDLSKASCIIVEMTQQPSYSRFTYQMLPVGFESSMASSQMIMFNTQYTGTGTSNPNIVVRRITAVTETGVTFTTGHARGPNGTTATTADTGYGIPLRIWAR